MFLRVVINRDFVLKSNYFEYSIRGTGRKDMGYPVGYSILSNMVLGYGMDRRDPDPISFKRYGIKFKTGYPTEWYIRGTIPRDNRISQWRIR